HSQVDFYGTQSVVNDPQSLITDLFPDELRTEDVNRAVRERRTVLEFDVGIRHVHRQQGVVLDYGGTQEERFVLFDEKLPQGQVAGGPLVNALRGALL